MDDPSDLRRAVQAIRLATAAGLRRQSVSWSYRAILFFVALVLIALPGLYGVISFAFFAFLHLQAVNAAMALELGWLGFGLAYAGPALVALVLTAILLKPFVAPRREERAGHIVTRGQEPGLHAFVDALCSLVGAPRPTAIEVSCDVNAGADLRRGLASLRDGDVLLTIGLPVVAGLDMKQLAGVLAHELGHFSQRAGLRLLHLVRATNRWFERAVYEQDAWDQALGRLVSNPWPGVRGMIALTVAALATGIISLSRLLLWPLMVLARLASVTLLRQLELDADRVHASVVGSECFEQTLIRMAILTEGTQRAAATVEQAWAQGRLGDDLTALIVDHADALGSAEQADVEMGLFAIEADWSSSHPSPRERIEATANLERDGVLDLEGPGTALFENFGELARRLTLAEYRERLGDEVSPESLVATSWIHEQRREIQYFQEAVLRFFGIAPDPDRPLSLGLSWMAAPGTRAEELEQLVAARRAMVEALPQVHRAVELAKGDEFQRQVAEVTISELEDHGARRMSAGLRILEMGAEGKGRAAPDLEGIRGRARELRANLVIFEPIIPKLCDLNRDRREAEMLGALLDDRDRSPWAMKKLIQLVPVMAVKMGGIRAPLTQHPFPYPHASQGMTIGRYALDGLPDATDPATVLEATYQLTERLQRFYVRVLGELVTMVEAVEAEIGLDALDFTPPGSEDAEEASSEVA